jgi:hypothetical protein
MYVHVQVCMRTCTEGKTIAEVTEDQLLSYDRCVCMHKSICVHVCIRYPHNAIEIRYYPVVCLRMCVCVCLCVYLYVYARVCMCVSVSCVCFYTYTSLTAYVHWEFTRFLNADTDS